MTTQSTRMMVRRSPHVYEPLAHSDEFAVAAEYFADLVKVFREEINDLYNAGCRRIQFDDPGFAFYCSDVLISGMEAAGVDREKLLDTHIDVYNQITADRPADLVIAVHTCRGNMKVSSRRVLARVQVSR